MSGTPALRLAKATEAFQAALQASSTKAYERDDEVEGERQQDASLFDANLFSIDTSLYMPKPGGIDEREELIESLVNDNERLKEKLNSVVESTAAMLNEFGAIVESSEKKIASLTLEQTMLVTRIQVLERQQKEDRKELATACRLLGRVRGLP